MTLFPYFPKGCFEIFKRPEMAEKDAAREKSTRHTYYSNIAKRREERKRYRANKK